MIDFIRTDAITGLRTLPDASVHCAVFSPPYFGLRDYKLEPLIWDADPNCDHVWETVITAAANGLVYNDMPPQTLSKNSATRSPRKSEFCSKCNAWRGQLGLEPSSDLFIQHLVDVCRELRRVMRSDSLVFLNIGDSYFGDSSVRTSGWQTFGETWDPENDKLRDRRSAARREHLKPKDLCMMPARVALALQADGWFLRSDTVEEVELYCPCGCGYVLEERITRYAQDREVIWSKPNPMPESVRDRPTRSHEYIFILSKTSKYFWDAEAVKEAIQSGPSDIKKMLEKRDRIGGRTLTSDDALYAANRKTKVGTKRAVGDPSGRNLRSVWTVATVPYKDAHFATFPPEIPRKAILAGTSEKGACGECGAPWTRIVELIGQLPGRERNRGGRTDDFTLAPQWPNGVNPTTVISHGWKPGCACAGYQIRGAGKARHRRLRARLAKLEKPSLPLFDVDDSGLKLQAVDLEKAIEKYWTNWQRRVDAKFPKTTPCTVVDCFAGSGTTGEVALELGRRAILIEPNPEYAPMIERRTTKTQALQFI